MKLDALVVGSPQTVRRHVEQVRDTTGIDYFVGAFAWGDLTHDEVRESMGLFIDHVMPGM